MGEIYFTSAPVIPTVGGQVVEVPIAANTPLKKGDVLFRIDPRPYQFTCRSRSRQRSPKPGSPSCN